MPMRDPENLHRLFAERVNAGDLDGLVSLYEDGATLVGPDGAHAQGGTALRERLEALLAMAPKIDPGSSRALVVGDIALMSGSWRMTFGSGEERQRRLSRHEHGGRPASG